MSSDDAVALSWGRLRRGILRRQNNPAVAENDALTAKWDEIEDHNNLALAVRQLWAPRPGAT